MAIEWPNTLPAPLRQNIVIRPNTSIKTMVCQSGRKVLRRFGASKPDTMQCTVRLFKKHHVHGDQVRIFEKFYDRSCNLGMNWIAATWLEKIGYTDHYFKISGKMSGAVIDTKYRDYSLTLYIQKKEACWADTSWPRP